MRMKIRHKICILLLSVSIVAMIFSGCSTENESNSSNETTTSGQEQVDISNDSSADSTDNSTIIDSIDTMKAYVMKYTDTDEALDYTKLQCTTINFGGTTAEILGTGASFDNSILTISKGGNYVFSGTLSDGQINISVDETEKVYLFFNGVNINCGFSAAIWETTADKVIITMVDGTENKITDGEKYTTTVTEDTSEDVATDVPTAAIYCQDSLTINGTGSLSVTANNNDGITSKDKLKIMSGTINITSADDGLVGKDLLAIREGTVTINSTGDGIKSTKSGETEEGIVYIDGGIINITSETDGIQAENFVKVVGGDISLNTGGGSKNASTKSSESRSNGNWGQWGKGSGNEGHQRGGMNSNNSESSSDSQSSNNSESSNSYSGTPSQLSTSMEQTDDTSTDSTSAKAIKADAGIYIAGGTINIDSSDDAIHSNNMVAIAGGIIDIASGDDGVHADTTIEISGGTTNITKSYEGIEANYITVIDGTVSLVASDDGFNAAGGTDSSSFGRPGENQFSSTEDGETPYINIQGGNISVDADGDGVDSNGKITMSSGTLIVNGPQSGGNGILDYDSTFTMTGGTLMAAGASEMFQSISSSSTVCVINENISGNSGDKIILSSGDKEIASFTVTENFSAIIFANEELETGKSYTISVGSQTYDVEAGDAVDYSGM